MRILYARDRIATPWKNGGGTTTEVLAYPQGADLASFGWRISIAQVRDAGPFSIFPGVDRKLALFEGRMSLAIAGQGAVALSPQTLPVVFPGDAAVDATLPEGTVTDLNVMTRRGVFTSRMERRRATGRIVFDSSAIVSLAFPLGEVSVLREDATIALVPGDAILGARENVRVTADVDYYAVEVFLV